MSEILNSISEFFIPGLIFLIVAFGAAKKVPVYDSFIIGAKDGLKTVVEILPFILGIFIAIQAMVSSGAMDFLESLVAPLFALLHVPEELISLILLRPVSGSGSLVIMEQILNENGVDSFIGRVAAVMTGSCETVFYVLAIYFGVTCVKKTRHALHVGLIGYVIGIFASLFACMMF